MAEPALTIALAYLLDLWIGDPRYGLHPVRLMGRGIEAAEKLLRSSGWEGKGGGILLLLAVASGTLLCSLCLTQGLNRLHPFLAFLFHGYLVYSCLALGDLLNHIRPLIRALESGDMPGAREALAMVVGRDVTVLDEHGMARAAVETLAENFVDGFLSPVFWFLSGWALSRPFGGSEMDSAVGFMLLFKVASTLDSMVGYRNPRYARFGWAGARLDDLMNFIPARLSIAFLFAGAVLSGLDGAQGIRVSLRDRLKHDSPNSAHAESFVAGALGIRLGGPTVYPEGMKQKPWLGTGRTEVGPPDIRRTVLLLRVTGWMVLASTLGAILLIGSPGRH